MFKYEEKPRENLTHSEGLKKKRDDKKIEKELGE
jgi:hypothetical protein